MESTDTPSLKDKRILIVEDQYLIAVDLGRALAKLGGMIVGPVSSTEAARAHLAQVDVDFAFLDINLGEQMVFPLADELERRGIPIVFATGYDEAILPPRFKTSIRLEKPFTLHGIIDAVRRLTAPG